MEDSQNFLYINEDSLNKFNVLIGLSDQRSMIDGVSKIKDDLQPIEVDFDMMEDDLVMMHSCPNIKRCFQKSVGYSVYNNCRQ